MYMASGEINKPVVIENGGENGHLYVRFSDGTQICYGSFSVTPTTWSAWGSLYTTDMTANSPFIKPFINDSVLITLMNGSSAWAIPLEVHTSASAITTLSVARATNHTGNQVWRYIAIGRWK